MDAYRTSLLSNAHDWCLHLLASSHDKVAELVDNHHDIGHKLVEVAILIHLVTQFLAPTTVIVFELALSHFLKHEVAVLHLLNKRVKGLHHLSGVGDNCLLFAFNLGKEIFLERSI